MDKTIEDVFEMQEVYQKDINICPCYEGDQIVGVTFLFQSEVDGQPVDREEAIETARQRFLDGVFIPEGYEYEYFLEIEMPECGETIAYQEPENVPHEDVPCTCGNPNHWFIKYDIVT